MFRDLKMRPLEFLDLPRRVDIFNEKSVFYTMRFPEKLQLEKTQKWFLANKENHTRKDFVFYATSNQEIIGLGGLTNINKSDNHAELYIAIQTISQGMGFGKKSMHLLCEYGFTIAGLNRIYLLTFHENEKASRLYKSMGFKQEGVLRQHALHGGEYKNRIIFGLLKEEMYREF